MECVFAHQIALERLARVRRLAVARLRRLTREERARIIKTDHEWEAGPRTERRARWAASGGSLQVL